MPEGLGRQAREKGIQAPQPPVPLSQWGLARQIDEAVETHDLIGQILGTRFLPIQCY